ncbi:MAG: hypothetical protein JWM16_4508 [Verrucomicrobiales bacterium]|nr:hypothetical protein [Verrucomicrobiales bacterium]
MPGAETQPCQMDVCPLASRALRCIVNVFVIFLRHLENTIFEELSKRFQFPFCNCLCIYRL